MSGWKQKLTFLDKPRTKKSDVQGQEMTFYPVTVGALFHLRTPAKAIGKALAAIFTNTSRDTASVGDATTTRVEAVSPELAQMRLVSQQKAIDEVVDAFSDDKNIGNLGYLIMDSLQEVFPRGNPDNPPPEEFIKTLPGPAVFDMLVGVAKANEGLFGPLVPKLRGAFSKVEQAVRSKLGEIPGMSLPTKSSESGNGDTTETGSSPSNSNDSPASTSPASV